jgi:hypothetical protein
VSDDIERRLDVLSGEIRDLVSWLKTEHTGQLQRIDNALGLVRVELRDHDKQIAQLKIDNHDHGKRIAAIEAALGKDDK